MSAPKALALFYRTLAELLDAGVPVAAALEQAAGLLRGARGLGDVVERGDTLAQALATAPGVFPLTHRRLLAAAERSGRFEAALRQLAALMEQVARVRAEILGGLALPALVFHLGAVLGPLPRLVRGGTLGDYIVESFGLIAVAWAVLAVAVIAVHRAPPAWRDAVMLRLPWFSELWRELDLWWLASGMEMLTNAGVGTIAALRECAEHCRSAVFARTLRSAAARAEARGEPVGTALAAVGALPRDVLVRWQTGERSGYLDQALAQIARDFGARVEARGLALAAWMPRVVYGAVCVFMVVQIVRARGGAA